MENLIKAGLYGAGLIDVDTPVMVARYNRCLEKLGIEGTKLEKFRIDCVGWSPEIVAEKDNNLYLSHGVPNQMAVILTPDQCRRPIYFPFNSFERRMIDKFFSEFQPEIADITASNAIALAINQGLTELSTPQDLLLIDHVTIAAVTDGDLMESARQQRGLVEKFMNEREAWFDASLRVTVLDSARKHGDLRHRKLSIPEMHFHDLRSFYSVAFGGVFVIRTEPGIDDLLIVQEKGQLGPGKRHGKNMLWIHDPKLLDRLFDHGIVEVDFAWFQQHPKELDYRLECLAADALCSQNGGLSFEMLPLAKRKKNAARHENLNPVVF